MSFENPLPPNPVEKKLTEIKASRLDVFESPDRLPAAVTFGREIRTKLKETIETDGWPKAPDRPESTNGFFKLVDQTVADHWQQKVGDNQGSALDLLQHQTAGWLDQLTAEARAENPDVVESLTNPQKLEGMLCLKKLGALEPLRKLLPTAWETLIAVASERQLAQIALSKKWLNEMPDTAFAEMEFSRNELVLQNDLAALAGKLIDHGYLKQDELDKTFTEKEDDDKAAGVAGQKYIYSLPGQSQATSFKDVLPFELQRLQKDLEFLAKKTEGLQKNNQLPESYLSLPAYLRQMAATYNSPEKDKNKLYQQWQNLYQANAELLKSGCPLVINPQEDNPFNVVGLEMRLGLCSPELKQLEQQSSNYSTAAYEIMQQIWKDRPNITNDPPAKADLFFSNQTYAFGPNVVGETMAESYHGQMFIHANAVETMAEQVELPLLHKMLPQEKIDQPTYIRQAILETARHELAHGILASDDEKVMAKVGESAATNVIEELKAETIGLKLVEQDLPQMPEAQAKQILLAKLGTLFNYLATKTGEKNSEGEDYYLCGVKLTSRLLETGAMKMENNALTIVDAKAGLKDIIKIGDEILDIYQSPKTTPKTINNYVNQVRKIKNTAEFKDFLKVLKESA